MYIWNRPDRVPAKNLNPTELPPVLIIGYMKLEQQKLKKATGKKAKRNLRNKIRTQTVAYEDAINSIRNKQLC